MLFAPLRSWTSASEPAARQNTGRRWANTSPREIIRQRYFPNLLLTTQENQQVRLYDDLIKDKVVLIISCIPRAAASAPERHRTW